MQRETTVGLGIDERLRTRFGAIALALLTLAAVIFAFLNFRQSSRFISPSDGAAWVDTNHGVVALHVVPDGPAERAGIRQGDQVRRVSSTPIYRSTDITRVIWHAGPWSELAYQILRDGEPL
jgi:S1-C subfamily serine protease